MKARDKKKKDELSEIIRYHSGEMTDRERSAFEMEMQKDPFTAEAEEGLSGISSDEARADMELLGKKLRSVTSGRRKFIYYRIAASVAVLMILSSVFLIIRQTRPEQQIKDIPQAPAAIEITKPESITEPAGGQEKVSIAEREEKKALERTTKSLPVKVEEDIEPEQLKQEGAGISETAGQPARAAEKRDIAVYNEKGKNAAAPSAVLTKMEPSGMQVRGRIISTEDNQPVPGATITVKGTTRGTVTDNDGNFSLTMPDDKNRTLVASYIGMESKEIEAVDRKEMQIELEPSAMSLDEVVVVGYGAKKADAADQAEPEASGYIPPQPSEGQKSFDRYIEENIRKPSTSGEDRRAVVVLNFMVTRNGIVDSIRVVRSPGEEFSREAVRLIKEGPLWKPAMSNGEKIDDEVRIRIVFK